VEFVQFIGFVFCDVQQWQGDFEFFHLTDDRNQSAKQEYKWNRATPMEMTLNMLLDIQLMSDCNFFIGAQRYTRVATT
jgi:hypothetical protein